MTELPSDSDLDIKSGPQDELYWWYRTFEATLALEMREKADFWKDRIYDSPRITRQVLRDRLLQINNETYERDTLHPLPDLPKVIFSKTGRATLEEIPAWSGAGDEEGPTMYKDCTNTHPPPPVCCSKAEAPPPPPLDR